MDKAITKKYLYVLIIFTLLISCKGQTQFEKSEETNIDSVIGKKVTSLDTAIWSFYQDKKNNYWFGSNGTGAYYYDGKSLTQFTKKDGLAGNQIRVIQADKFGNIYFDTFDGVSKFDGKRFTTLVPNYTSENEWKSDPNDLWFRTNGNENGVFRYDGTTLFHLKFPEYDLEKAFSLKFENRQFSPFGTYSIYKDKKENLWFGTLTAGVFQFNGESLNWIAEKELTRLDDGRSPAVRSIIEDKDGDFWMSNILNRYKITITENGAFKYEKLVGIENKKDQKTMELPYYLSAITDNTGHLWMATYNEGVWKYDGKDLFHYPIKDGETDVLLFSIYKDNSGTLWLGTHNAGAYIFNGHTFQKFGL